MESIIFCIILLYLMIVTVISLTSILSEDFKNQLMYIFDSYTDLVFSLLLLLLFYFIFKISWKQILKSALWTILAAYCFFSLNPMTFY